MAASSIIILIAFMLGYTVTGLVGFGGNILILPILSILKFPVQELVAVMAFVSFVNALYRVVETHRAVEWKRLLGLWCITIPGAFLGVWLLKNVPEEIMKFVLGLFIVVLAFYNLRKNKGFDTPAMLRRESHGKHVLYHLLLFVGGVLQGAFVCGGPLYVIFCSHYFGYDRQKYRGMQFGVMVINSFAVFMTYWLHGDYVGETAVLCLPALIGIVLAVVISGRVLKKIDDKKLYVLIQLVLIISGANLILQFF